MKLLFFVLSLSFSQVLFCQVTFIIDSLPLHHDYEKDIYISGDFEGWTGGQKDFKLSKNNKHYQITIPKIRESISFKFTLGSWSVVECQLNGSPLENRVYSFNKSQDTVYVKIDNWETEVQKLKPSTASKNVHVFSENYKIPQLNRERKISVYLPPDYELSNKKYPVLYIHDGQNVFDAATAYAGEWEVDETLNRLSSKKGLNLIVVAIDHGNDKRIK